MPAPGRETNLHCYNEIPAIIDLSGVAIEPSQQCLVHLLNQEASGTMQDGGQKSINLSTRPASKEQLHTSDMT